jgi:anti-sigma factor RsiW
MSACEDKELLLHALLDGELDAANTLACEAHLRNCAGCAAEFERIAALRSRLRTPGVAFEAPAELRARVMEALAAAGMGVESGVGSGDPASIVRGAGGRDALGVGSRAGSAVEPAFVPRAGTVAEPGVRSGATVGAEAGNAWGVRSRARARARAEPGAGAANALGVGSGDPASVALGAGARDVSGVGSRVGLGDRPAGRPNRPRKSFVPWAMGGSIAALAAALAFVLLVHLPARGVADELVASHVRSLLATHLVDVVTSDRHVVKPWFAGKVDFSPPVLELADKGFPLAGGRLDYIHGRVVAAVVYRRRQHIINVFVWPAGALDPGAASSRRDGYNVVGWEQGGLQFYAVSDVDPADLRELRADFAQAGG